jgi:hypothetical protein
MFEGMNVKPSFFWHTVELNMCTIWMVVGEILGLECDHPARRKDVVVNIEIIRPEEFPCEDCLDSQFLPIWEMKDIGWGHARYLALVILDWMKKRCRRKYRRRKGLRLSSCSSPDLITQRERRIRKGRVGLKQEAFANNRGPILSYLRPEQQVKHLDSLPVLLQQRTSLRDIVIDNAMTWWWH